MKTITIKGLQFNVWQTSFCLAEPGMHGPVIYVGHGTNLMAALKGVATTIKSAMECQHATDVAALAETHPSKWSN
jgi:hypothetical protein